MKTRSLHDMSRVETDVAPQAITNGTVAGAGLDTADSDLVHTMIPVTAWTDGSHLVHFFERDATTDAWVRVPAIDLHPRNLADMTTEVVSDVTVGLVTIGSGAYDGTVIQIGYIGQRRYYKVDIVTTGATTGAVLGHLVQQARLDSAGNTPDSERWISAVLKA